MSVLVWRQGLDEPEQAAVRSLVAAVTDADGAAPFSEHVLLHLGPGEQPAAHMLAWAGSELSAMAHLDPDGSAELAVHPAYRRAGLGTAVARELLANPAGAPVRIWSHGEHPGAAALAARLGLRAVRELSQLRLTLTEEPEAPAWPDGIRLRSFRVGLDEAEFLRVNKAAFGWHPEQGGWGTAEIEQREREPWFDPEGFLLAVDPADTLLGYHWTKVHPAEGGDGPLGEVYVLGVDPAARGRQLGRALTLAGLRHLYDRGLRTVLLYTEADNEPALRLYEALGFTRWRTDVMYAR